MDDAFCMFVAEVRGEAEGDALLFVVVQVGCVLAVSADDNGVAIFSACVRGKLSVSAVASAACFGLELSCTCNVCWSFNQSTTCLCFARVPKLAGKVDRDSEPQ
jgi:hypothetical protein